MIYLMILISDNVLLHPEIDTEQLQRAWDGVLFSFNCLLTFMVSLQKMVHCTQVIMTSKLLKEGVLYFFKAWYCLSGSSFTWLRLKKPTYFSHTHVLENSSFSLCLKRFVFSCCLFKTQCSTIRLSLWLASPLSACQGRSFGRTLLFIMPIQRVMNQ